MSERLETKRCIKMLYKYTAYPFPFLSFSLFQGHLQSRPAVTFPAEERHRPLTSTKLYCLLTEAHRCEQLAQGCYAALLRYELNL